MSDLIQSFMLCIIMLKLSSIDKESCESTTQLIEDIPFNSTSYYLTDDIDTNKGMLEREDFERDLYEIYPHLNKEHLMNHLHYPFDEPFFNYPDYDEFSDYYQHRVENEYVKSHTLEDRKPTPKPNFADGKTWYVDDDSECRGDGSKEWPYCKIQYAIDASKDGDMVFVYSGTYYENVVVDKSIILQGEDRDTTIIDGHEGWEVARIWTDYVSICRFTIKNGHRGILLDETANSTIIDNIITLNNWGGIQLHNSNNNSIKSNVVSFNTEAGISLEVSGNNTISCNDIYSNHGDGINLEYSHQNNISANEIKTSYWEGISLEYSQDNIISKNNASNNRRGIVCYFSNNTLISRNRLNSNSWDGMLLSESVNNEILNNDFVNDGLRVWDTYKNNISGNVVNGKPLVCLTNKANKIIDYDTGQIILIECNKIIIKNQNISKTDIGIHLVNSNNCTITDSTIGFNYDHGILFSNSNDSLIFNNLITENGEEGIKLSESNNNMILENSVSKNKFGITLSFSDNNAIFTNIIESNTQEGIRIGNYGKCDNNSINDNYFSSNDFFGINIYYPDSKNNLISNNSFNHDGIFDYNTQPNTITDNTVNGKPLVYLIGKSNYTIDCDAGQIILVRCYNITIQDYNLSNTCVGLELWDSNNCVVTNCTFNSNNYAGIYLYLSGNITVSNNILSNNYGAMAIVASNNGNIFGNIVTKNDFGITLMSCGCNIRNNIIKLNKNDGMNIMYSDSNIVSKNDITQNYETGVRLRDSTGNFLNSNKISHNLNGISIEYYSNNNYFSKENIYSNLKEGFSIKDSDSNIISNCTIQNHKFGSGILIESAYNTAIKDNFISDNMRGGIKLDYLSSGSNIIGCVLTHNSWGIDLTTSESNMISGCTIANNNFGGIHRGRNNTIIENNFIRNNRRLHYFGLSDDKNYFNRNYWSGHITPLPYRVWGWNFDWFPRAIPYIIPPIKMLIDNPSDQLLDSDFEKILQGDFNDQNSHFYLGDRVSDRLSSLFSKVHNVLNQDQRHLLNGWRNGG